MIDGIQLTYHVRKPESHLLGLLCWEVLTNEKTGQRVNDEKTAHFRGLDLKLKSSSYDGHNFLVNGSLHKFHNCGQHNADQFTFQKLFQSIDSFTDVFSIDPTKCFIHGIEIGVNIELPFPPIRVLKNVVCYRSRPFTQINKRSAAKGLQCSLTQYRVKVYDKAKQSGIDCGNVLRFEVAIDKMQVLAKYRVTTLADLQDFEKVRSLIGVLREALEGIVWTDTTANLNRLSDREQKQWLYFSNPKTWGQMSKFQRNRAFKKWETLLHRYGNPIDLLPLLLDTWSNMCCPEMEAENPQPFYRHFSKVEAEKSATFLQLVCTGKRLRTSLEDSTLSKTTFLPTTTNQKRFCLSCGKDISNQSNQTIFCSEKLHGKAAKRCRNKSSNKRRGQKRKINSAMKKNGYLLITYTDGNGNSYSDILHPSELSITKEWLDKIQSIESISTENIKPKTT